MSRIIIDILTLKFTINLIPVDRSLHEEFRFDTRVTQRLKPRRTLPLAVNIRPNLIATYAELISLSSVSCATMCIMPSITSDILKRALYISDQFVFQVTI